MKKIRFTVLIFALALVFAGCSSEISVGAKKEESKEENNNGYSTEAEVVDLASQLAEKISFDDTMTEINDSTVLNLYGLTADQIQDMSVYMSTGATAEEIAVFNASSDTEVEAVYTACKNRVGALESSYKDYKPDELERLSGAILKKSGTWVVLCIATDKQGAEDIINAFIK